MDQSAQQFAAEVADHIDHFLQLRGLPPQDRLVFARTVERYIVQHLNEDSANERSDA